MGIVAASFAAVLLSELIGDRTLIAIGTLATRARVRWLVLGLVPAFMVKMAVAVSLGHALHRLPRGVFVALSALTFASLAIVLWRKRAEPVLERPLATSAAAFLTIFLSEWGDAGQLTAAVLAGRWEAPVPVWIGAVAAMTAKSAIAIFVGRALKRALSFDACRWIGVATAAALLVASVCWPEAAKP